MGSAHSDFVQIEKKYGLPGVDYIVHKYNERIAYQQTRDELQRINDHINLQEKDDLEWIDQEKRTLHSTLDEAHKEAELVKKGAIAESEAKHKMSVREFSGFNDVINKLNDLEKKVREQYKIEKDKVKGKVDETIKKSNISTLKALPEFDKRTDAAKRSIEEECVRKYPSKVDKSASVEVERHLKWENFKPTFDAILNKQQIGLENTEARNRMKGNLVPAKGPLCC